MGPTDRSPRNVETSTPLRGSRALGRALFVGDTLCLLLPAMLIEALAWPSDGTLGAVAVRISLMVAAGLYVMHIRHLHRAARSSVVTAEVAALLQVGFAMLVTGVVLDEYTFGEIWWTRSVASALLAAGCLILWRSVFRARLRAFRREGRFVRPVIIVGISPEAKRLHRLLHDHPDAGFRSLGVVGDRERAKEFGLGAAWAGPMENAIESVEHGAATGVILVASALPAKDSSAIARRVQALGGHVHVSSGIGGIDHRRFSTQPIAHEPLLYLDPPHLNRSSRFIKRAIDIVLSAVGLALLAPFLLLAAVAIKLEDRGPVVFRQRRVGHNGAEFTILKLRTMVIDAERVRDEFAADNVREGPLFKLDRDPRITRVGRVLRKTDLDEAPQLINVLRGQMSLVGPRPALPSEVEQFDDALRARTRVLPGLTGLWQVESRDSPSFEAYQRLDLFYVENWSVVLDLVIMLLTVESKLVQMLSKRTDADLLDDGELFGPEAAAPEATEPAADAVASTAPEESRVAPPATADDARPPAEVAPAPTAGDLDAPRTVTPVD